MFYTLIYVSELIDPTDQSMLDDIREQAINLNQAEGITGLLLHSPSHFCQILQGAKSAVEQTMERIRRDVRHRHPVVILRTDFPAEMFPDWSMATSKVSVQSTVATIARTHTDRLARPEDIDHIVETMQQYRFGNHPLGSTVVSRSQQDHSLLALGVSGKNEESLDSMIELGAGMFESDDLLLMMKRPDCQKLHIKTTSAEIYERLRHKLSHSQDQIDVWIAEKSTGTEVRGNPPKIISEVCSSLGCQGAIGWPIYIGIGYKEGEGSRQDTFQAASIWFLQKPGVDEFTPATDDTRARFVSCLEHLLEQQRVAFESELLQRKAQRQQLASAANLERQHLVLNVASSAIIALDSDCRVLMINQSARALFNLQDVIPFRWPKKIEFLDVNGQSKLKDYECPIHRAVNASRVSIDKIRARKTIDGQIKDGQSKDWERLYENSIVAHIPVADARMVYLKCTAIAVNEADSAVSVVIVFDDITELERNRERIRRSDRLEALGHLTGGIAHDFNNLLSTVLNAVELASVELRQVERQSLLNLVVDTVKRGTELTNRLVAFAAAQPVKAEVHSMSDILKAVEELARASVSSDVNLVISRVPDSLAVLCDAGQLENALLNLLINSRDAIVSSGIGSKVQVAVELLSESSNPGSPGVIEIRVTDDGPGMSSSDIQRAADPFFTTKESSGGSGLGLSMVYRFIQQSGGELLIDNVAEGSGLCVRMLIGQTNAPPEIEPIQPLVSNRKADQFSILLVEDDIDFGTVLQKSLQYIGHYVVFLSNAEEVLHRMEGPDNFDLLLTDVVMPGVGVDGFGLADRAVEIKPNIKVIYLSGYIHPNAAESYSLHGPILRKPISISTLSEAIQQQLATEDTVSS